MAADDLAHRYADAARLWEDALGAAGAVLTRAAHRAGLETRDLWYSLGTNDGALAARLGDLARSQASLWATASLSALELLGRAHPLGGLPLMTAAFAPLPQGPSSVAPAARAGVLGVVASELWLGYAVLRERARWAPGLVQPADWALQHRRGAGRVLDAASGLGGSLIKAAQFASTRPDLLPPAYTEVLASLQDRVPPQPWPVIEQVLTRELGRAPLEVFAEIDHEPLAAASIAQVHRARLNSGRWVALKVQYPGIEALIETDLAALEAIIEMIGRLEPAVQLRPILDYLRWTLPLELDFRREAAAAAALRETIGQHDWVLIPEVIEGLSTERLLVSELVGGVKISDRAGLIAAGIDPAAVAERLVQVYAEQLFQHRVFHADPHPGNLFVQPGVTGPDAGPVLVLLDHGLTTRLADDLVDALGEATAALLQGDLAALANILRGLGLTLDAEVDHDTLRWLMGLLLGGQHLAALAGGEAVATPDAAQIGLQLGQRIGALRTDLLLVGRGIGLIDGLVRQLAPQLDSFQIMAGSVLAAAGD